jgi:hypothetical protein
VSRSVASLVPLWGARESSGLYILYKALLCFSPVDCALTVGPRTLLHPTLTSVLHLVDRGDCLILQARLTINRSISHVRGLDIGIPHTSVSVSGLHWLLVLYPKLALIGLLIAIRSFAYLLHAIIIDRPAHPGTGRPVVQYISDPSVGRTTNLERHLTLPHLTLFHSYLRLAARLRILETPKFRSDPISSVAKHSFSGGQITGF